MNEKGEPIIDLEACIGCGKCVKICPAERWSVSTHPEEQAILAELEKQGVPKEAPKEEKKPRADESYRGVWVFVEQKDGVAAQVSWELLGSGTSWPKIWRRPSAPSSSGKTSSTLRQEAFAYGADEGLPDRRPDPPSIPHRAYLRGAVQLVEKYKPEIVLMGATGLGRDLAGAVATALGQRPDRRLHRPGHRCEKRLLVQTRPAFGGNIMATILTEDPPPADGLGPAARHAHAGSRSRDARGEIDPRDARPHGRRDPRQGARDHPRRPAGDDVDIAGADVIVSGGRGMHGPQRTSPCCRSWPTSWAASSARSRGAVDAGWMPHDRQVGQTGKTVRPKIYIACGISGAIQHLVGMQDSDVIIAINRDKEAPIFEVATYGIVGDLFQIVPALTAEVPRKCSRRSRRSGKLAEEGSLDVTTE